MNRSMSPVACFLAAATCSTLLAQCPADVDHDDDVGASDLAAVLAAWGTDGAGKFFTELTGDAVVDAADLALLLASWGSCRPTVPEWATLLESYPDPAVIPSASIRERIIDTGFAWHVRDTQTGIEMMLIPPGTFQMGCSASFQSACEGDENPVHAVTLTNAFYMGRYEVTQAEWTARMGSNPSYFQSASAQVPAAQVPRRPVEQVSWERIAGKNGFLAGTGLRLPTEAEWEYACRAGTTTAFHGWPAQQNGTSDDTQVGNIAWFASNSSSQTRPVGQKAGNGFGLHDMSGNVYEWVNDRYSSTYYASSPSTNPPGPSTGLTRVFRGGAWNNTSDAQRVSLRIDGLPSSSIEVVGFRVARAP